MLERRPKRPATAGAFIRSVSPVSASQNTKASEMEAKLVEFVDSRSEEAQMAAMDKRATLAQGAFAVQFLSQQFDADVKEFQGELNECGRRIRMEGNFAIMDAKARAKMEEEFRRAEEKRKRDEATRKLRQAAKEAQNPKRRVAIRLEQQRMASEADIAAKVPMKNIEAGGGYGDRVPMVDIRLLQSKALGLNLGGSRTFGAIYGLACDKERIQAWEANALGPEESREDYVKKNKAPGGDSLMSRTQKVINAKLLKQQQRYDERERQAQVRRRQLFEEDAFRRVSATRSGDLTRESQTNPTAARALKEMEAEVAKARETGSPVSPAVARRLSRMPSGLPLGLPAAVGVDDGASSATSVSRTSRGFWWGVVRSVLCMVWLLNVVRAKNLERD